MIETTRVLTWLVDAISDITELASVPVYAHLAPEGSAFPFIVVTPISPRDTNALNTTDARVLVDGIWDIRAVDRSRSFAALESIVDALDGGLQGATHADTDGWFILGCIREAPIELVELNKGVEYRHLGGQYRIQIRVPSS